MRWPWVSREPSEAYVRELRDAFTARITAVEADRDEWRLMYRELLEKYDNLRTQGANPAPPVVDPPAPVVAPKATPDIVSAAIAARSRNSIVLHRHYSEYVSIQRAAGISDEEIAAGILEGHSDDNEGVL